MESSVWILIVSMIATMNIKKATDRSGNPIEPKVIFENAVFRTPSPFECTLELRSEEAGRLLEAPI